MNILVVKTTRSGVYYHRQLTWARTWAWDYTEDNIIIADSAEKILEVLKEHEVDIIFFSLSPIFFKEHLKEVKEIIKEKRIVLISDIDDYYSTERKDIAAALKNSKAIITPNPYLKKVYEKRGAKNVYLVENGIDVADPQWRIAPFESDELVFGYLGSTRHEKDLKMMKHNFDEEALVTVADYDGTLNVNHVYGLKHWSDYALYYDDIHVSLRPLAPTIFNRSKSILGIVEAGFKKKACAVSLTEPYKYLEKELDGIVDFIPLGQSWGEYLEGYTIEEAEDKGEMLYEWVKDRYDVRILNQKRREIFEQILKTR